MSKQKQYEQTEVVSFTEKLQEAEQLARVDSVLNVLSLRRAV